jgi:NADH-quinone oxidoreductase subunit E
VERVACLGCCSLAPVVMIDGEVYGNLTGDKLGKVVSSVGAKAEAQA